VLYNKNLFRFQLINDFTINFVELFEFLFHVYEVIHFFYLLHISIYIARLDGAIVKSLVQRNPRDFIRTICIFLTVAIPASFINSFIRFAESKLALAFRSKLTHYAYELYFRVRFILIDLFIINLFI
jgi:ABC-type uncharacterized transport system fused permease/ATPase subunit